jgi:hypothetical protein
MPGATLIVSRVSETELRFVLQQAHAPQAAVMEARLTTSPDLKANIATALHEFAECLKGFHADEPDFKEIGQILFAVMLPQPIRLQLPELDGPLTILTDDPTLPWELLHDGTEFVALKLPVARQLIVHQQMAGVLRLPRASSSEFAALVIADPTADLPGAREEGRALLEYFSRIGTCDALFGHQATFTKILGRLVTRPYAVIHFCGHVDYDPIEHVSSIRLGGGGRLRVEDILPSFQGRPVVFLNACHSDMRVRAQAAPTESFAQAFLMGSEKGIAVAVVGTMWRVPDEPQEAGRQFSLAFYECLLQGGALGEALRQSRSMAREKEWGPMVWGPYVLYGDPNVMPFEQLGLRQIPAETQEQNVPPPGRKSVEDIESAKTEADQVPRRDDRVEKESDQTPLDTGGRSVFRIALREMAKLRQGALSSMHILIGLCGAGVEALTDELRKCGVDRDAICAAARQRAQELIPPEGENIGVSRNTLRILVLAGRRAKKLNRETIGAEDLLVGLLRCDDAEAVQILEGLGIRRGELLKRFRRPHWQFEAEVQEAVEHAIGCARQARLGFVGTPHILIGLIRTGGSRTISLLRKRSVNLELLCEKLKAGLGEGPTTGKNGTRPAEFQLTGRFAAVLHRAQQLAEEDAKPLIGEVHLLQSVLEQDGYTADLLERLGAPREALLADLAQEAEGTGH